MADVEDLRIILRAEVDKAVSDLKKASKGAKSADKDFGDLAKQFKKQVAEATNMSRAFSQMAGSVAAGLGVFTLASKGIQAMSQLARESVQAFQVQEQAVAKLEGVLRATGGAAGLTSQQMQAFAAELQSATTFGDEAIIDMQATLATFKSVSGDTFKDATRLALDLSAAFGGSLQSKAMQVGKALEDPVKGVTALKEVGLSFSEAQIEMITSLVESGNKAEAQRLILKELEGQVGGVASAMANTASGAMQQYKNALGDTKEEIGRFILNGIEPLARGFTGVVTAIGNALKAQNDYNAALKNQMAGVATQAEQLLVLQEELRQLSSRQRSPTLALPVELYNRELNALNSKITALQQTIRYQDQAGKAAEERARQEAAAAEAAAVLEQARQTDLQKYLDRVGSMYSQTSQGRIEKLEAEIAEFEKYAETAIKTAPQVAAVLQMLNEQLEKIKNPGTGDDSSGLPDTKDLDRLAQLYSQTAEGIQDAKDETLRFVEAQRLVAITSGASADTIHKLDAILRNLTASGANATEVQERLNALYTRTASGINAANEETIQFVQTQRELAVAAGATADELQRFDEILASLESSGTNDTMKEFAENIEKAAISMASDAFIDFFTALGEGSMSADSFGQSISQMAANATKDLARLALMAGIRIIAETGTAGLPIGLALLAIGGVAAIASAGFGNSSKNKNTTDYQKYISDAVIAEEQRLAQERIKILRKQLEDEKRIRDENLRKLEAHFSQEYEVLRDLWNRGLISTDDYQAKATSLRNANESERQKIEAPLIQAENLLKAEEEAQQRAKDELEKARQAKLTELANTALVLQQELNGMSGWDKFWSSRDNDIQKELALIDKRLNVVRSAQTVQAIQAAATGADFVTNGPQLLMVGDNPGGRERVKVEPIGSPNLHGPRGSEAIVIQINAPVYGVDQFYEILQQAGRRLAHRRRIIGEAF